MLTAALLKPTAHLQKLYLRHFYLSGCFHISPFFFAKKCICSVSLHQIQPYKIIYATNLTRLSQRTVARLQSAQSNKVIEICINNMNVYIDLVN